MNSKQNKTKPQEQDLEVALASSGLNTPKVSRKVLFLDEERT
jgi:hypothetical protein